MLMSLFPWRRFEINLWCIADSLYCRNTVLFVANGEFNREIWVGAIWSWRLQMVHFLASTIVVLFPLFSVPVMSYMSHVILSGTWLSIQMETRAGMWKNTSLSTWRWPEQIPYRLVGKLMLFSGCFCSIRTMTTTWFCRVTCPQNLIYLLHI